MSTLKGTCRSAAGRCSKTRFSTSSAAMKAWPRRGPQGAGTTPRDLRPPTPRARTAVVPPPRWRLPAGRPAAEDLAPLPRELAALRLVGIRPARDLLEE